MSSTDSSPDAGRFFDQEIIPLGERLHAESGPLFPRTSDSSVETYYTKTTRRTIAPQDFLLPNLKNAEEVREGLARLWSASGRLELVPLAETFGRWAAALRQEGPQSAEVSDLVYVMY